MVYWLLAREILVLRGKLQKDKEWDVKVDLFFYRDVEEIQNEEAERNEEDRDNAAAGVCRNATTQHNMHQKHRASRATNNNKYKFNNNTTTDSKPLEGKVRIEIYCQFWCRQTPSPIPDQPWPDSIRCLEYEWAREVWVSS
jgi:hypothetical protein